jgi:hypothetical protein
LVGAQDARDREEERVADEASTHGMRIINPFGGEEGTIADAGRVSPDHIRRVPGEVFRWQDAA